MCLVHIEQSSKGLAELQPGGAAYSRAGAGTHLPFGPGQALGPGGSYEREMWASETPPFLSTLSKTCPEALQPGRRTITHRGWVKTIRAGQGLSQV